MSLRHRPRSRLDELRRHLAKSGNLTVSGWDLERVDFSGRALIGITFVDCEFANTDFSGADLSTTRFLDCDLYHANFSGAVLYTTWFYECNLTKASFRGSYVLGFRLRSADITKTEFDPVPLVGIERKSRGRPVGRVLRMPLLGRLPATTNVIERDYAGIAMAGYPHAIAFVRESRDDLSRTRVRIAETAKYLRAVHQQNGYESLADDYYVVERRQRRMALQGGPLIRIRRAQDYLLGDILWRYGSWPSRPIVALVGLALTAAAITFAAPSLDPGTGLRPDATDAVYAFHGWGPSVVDYLNVVYFYLTSTVGGSQAQLTGWTKVIFVGYVLSAIWLIALTFEASIRRLGRSN